jgi:hypothetical protein
MVLALHPPIAVSHIHPTLADRVLPFGVAPACWRRSMSAALLIDVENPHTVQVAADLARLGCAVDAVARRSAPIMRSRHCRRGFVSPSPSAPEFGAVLRERLATGAYDAVYLCTDEVIASVTTMAMAADGAWPIPVSRPETVELLKSKNAVLDFLRMAGVPIPRTLVPDPQDLVSAARELGWPLLVKGDRGQGAQHVRFVDRLDQLSAAYAEIAALECDARRRPALQECVPGPTYLVGGLFDHGRPLRLCAHRMALMYPARGGETVQAVTERPTRAIDNALRAFAALEYHGLGEADMIRDERDGEFRILEINPRVWASIGLARHAGVDFYTPYTRLARGECVAPDLAFEEGIRYDRVQGELRLVRAQPRRIFGFLRNCLDPKIRNDFEWTDVAANLPSVEQWRRILARLRGSAASPAGALRPDGIVPSRFDRGA